MEQGKFEKENHILFIISDNTLGVFFNSNMADGSGNIQVP